MSDRRPLSVVRAPAIAARTRRGFARTPSVARSAIPGSQSLRLGLILVVLTSASRGGRLGNFAGPHRLHTSFAVLQVIAWRLTNS